MTRPAPPLNPHRAAALLIVLAVLLLSLTATTIIVSIASDAQAQRQLADYDRHADELLTAAEDPIQFWLATKASKVVLRADAVMPAVSVLHDRLMIPAKDVTDESIEAQFTITAFDQRGMVPMQLARGGSPLRLALPSAALERLDAVNLPPASNDAPLGLDLFTQGQIDERRAVAIYPAAISMSATSFGGDVSLGSMDNTDAEQQQRDPGESGMDTEAAIGGLLATHNFDPVRINICTAPLPLVEAALRMAGTGGGGGGGGAAGARLESIIVARNKGQRPAVARIAPAAAPSSSEAGSIPEIVTSSDRWSFRIDIAVGTLGHGGLRRSWWAVYALSPRPTRPGRPWVCIQRLAIDQ